MPRRTNTDYLQTRTWLKELWDDDLNHGWFGYLTANEQLVIHQYFRIHLPLTEDEVLLHRQTVTVQSPSIPQQAGKAVAHLERLIAYSPLQDPAYRRQQHQARQRAAAQTARTGKRVRALIVRSELRPDPDTKKIAKVIVDFALQQARNEASLPPSAASPRTSPQSPATSSPPHFANAPSPQPEQPPD